MRKLILASSIVASLVASTAAMAAAETVTGTIASMDAKACTVTLDNKTVYYFGAKCDFSALKANEKVTITFEKKGGKDEASKIEAAK